MNEPAVSPGALLPVAATPLQTRDAVVAPSYVVPQDTDQSRTVAPIRLTNYLMHHGEFASGLTRTSVNSNVVGAALEPVAVRSPFPLHSFWSCSGMVPMRRKHAIGSSG